MKCFILLFFLCWHGALFSMEVAGEEIHMPSMSAQASESVKALIRRLKDKLLEKGKTILFVTEEAQKLLVLMGTPEWAAAVLEAMHQACVTISVCTKLEVACLLCADERLEVWIRNYVRSLRSDRELMLREINSIGFSTPLIAAAQARSLSTVKFLVKAGAQVRAKDNTGNTPLATAAGTGSAKMVSYLLERGAQASLQENNNEGFLALYTAVCANATECVLLLLKQKATVLPRKESAVASLIRAAILNSNHGMVSILPIEETDVSFLSRCLLTAVLHCGLQRSFFSRLVSHKAEEKGRVICIIELLMNRLGEHLRQNMELTRSLYGMADYYNLGKIIEVMETYDVKRDFGGTVEYSCHVEETKRYTLEDFQTIVARDHGEVPLPYIIRVFLRADVFSGIATFFDVADPEKTFINTLTLLQEALAMIDSKGLLETIKQSPFTARCDGYLFGIKMSQIMKLDYPIENLKKDVPEDLAMLALLGFLKKQDTFVHFDPDEGGRHEPLPFRLILELGVRELMQDSISLAHETEILQVRAFSQELDFTAQTFNSVKAKIIRLMQLLRMRTMEFISFST